MHRRVEPEFLDSLPPDDPEALRNRRELRLVNRLMGNFRWFSGALPSLVRPSESVLEIGAGTGELARELQERGIPVDGLDLWPRPTDWPRERAWHRTDLQSFDGYRDYPVVVANLLLHQFEDEGLRRLGARLRENCRAVLACEPARRRPVQWLYGALAPLLGAGRVSRHDGWVSIRAGFRGDELAGLLGLAAPEWTVRCETFFGGYRMVAVRG